MMIGIETSLLGVKGLPSGDEMEPADSIILPTTEAWLHHFTSQSIKQSKNRNLLLAQDIRSTSSYGVIYCKYQSNQCVL